ncbi:MAG: CotH kinase family protein [Alphaproteobacteria bacterium]|nr:CotH kinase family protein [Alphaproteobacteria bacterium]MCB9794568.1 CotH kinase family protein [Alphaproteobacteria bacterium]
MPTSLLLLLACSPLAIEDSAPTQGLYADQEVEQLGPAADPIFSLERVHELEITLSDEAYDTLAAETEPYGTDPVYVEGSISWDGHVVESVGVRVKGRLGTWRPITQKSSFKIDLNRYVRGQTLFDRESLTVNNLVVDCSYLRESVGYPLYAAMGIPAPRTSYVRVSVNGRDKGLYLNVESPDDVYLDRHFAEPDGALYDADYIRWGDGSYTILDFYAELVEYFELEEGEDPDRAGLMAVVDALDAQGGLYARTDAVFDWDHHQRMTATEMWVGQVDGYSLNRNNYLVYLDPADGRARLLPWDHDYSFIHARDWGFSWESPRGRLTATCLQDAACRADLLDQVERVNEEAEALELQARADTLAALIEDEVARDRGTDCSASDVRRYQRSLESWLEDRSGELEELWGL